MKLQQLLEEKRMSVLYTLLISILIISILGIFTERQGYNKIVVDALIIIFLTILGFVIYKYYIVGDDNARNWYIGIVIFYIFTNLLEEIPELCMLTAVFENILICSVCYGGLIMILFVTNKKIESFIDRRHRQYIEKRFAKYLQNYRWSNFRCYDMVNFYAQENSSFKYLQKYFQNKYGTHINKFELYGEFRKAFLSLSTKELSNVYTYLKISISVGTNRNGKFLSQVASIMSLLNNTVAIIVGLGISSAILHFKSIGVLEWLQEIFKWIGKWHYGFAVGIFIYSLIMFGILGVAFIQDKKSEKKDVELAAILIKIVEEILEDRQRYPNRVIKIK